MAKYRSSIRINGKLTQARFSVKADADNWYHTKLREKELIKHGLNLPLTPINIEDYYRMWISYWKSFGKADSTYRLYQVRMEKFVLPSFIRRSLHLISTQEWEDFFCKLISTRKISSSTRNRYRSMLHKFYVDAIKQKYALYNPITAVDKLPGPIAPYAYLETTEECERYLSAANKVCSSFYLCTAIALNTGMRLGEILALQIEDIKFNLNYIQVFKTRDTLTLEVKTTTKGKSLRKIGLGNSLKAILLHLESENKAKFLFEISNYNNFRRKHERTLKLGGLKRIRIHDLRHTFASHYVMNGGSLSELQKVLGHSTYRMTEQYAHLNDRHILAKANLVSFGNHNK